MGDTARLPASLPACLLNCSWCVGILMKKKKSLNAIKEWEINLFSKSLISVLLKVLKYVLVLQPELVLFSGYPLEVHHIVTADGYILELHRIKHGYKTRRSPAATPALLHHGLFSSSADFVVKGPPNALGGWPSTEFFRFTTIFLFYFDKIILNFPKVWMMPCFTINIL